MTTSTKLSGGALAPRPPAKGSFPLDHLAECKPFAIAYERCLSANQKLTSRCRREARAYLECRMERGLMAKEEWDKLGLGKVNSDEGDSTKATFQDIEAEHGGQRKPEPEGLEGKHDKSIFGKGS